MLNLESIIKPEREPLHEEVNAIKDALFQWVFETKKVSRSGKAQLKDLVMACLHNGVDVNDPAQERLNWKDVEDQHDALALLLAEIQKTAGETLDIDKLSRKRRHVIAELNATNGSRGNASHAGGGPVRVLKDDGYKLPEAKGPYAEKFGATSKYQQGYA
jgi:hypothetical protein